MKAADVQWRHRRTNMNVKHVSAGIALALVLGTGYFPATAEAVGGAVRGTTSAVAHGGLGNRAHGSLDAAARGSAAAELPRRQGQIGRNDATVPNGLSIRKSTAQAAEASVDRAEMAADATRDGVRETASTTRERAGQARETANSNADAVRQDGTRRAEASVRQTNQVGGRVATRARESAASTERPNAPATPVGAVVGLGGDVAADASADRSGVRAASGGNFSAEANGHSAGNVEASAGTSAALQAEASADTPQQSDR
jgi:hypothetical protein